MNNRINKIFEESGLKKVEFANKIGIHQSYVTKMISGEKNPSDRTIRDICREFNVREEWLRDGIEPMYKARTRNQEIGAFMNDVMDLPDEAFKKRLIDALRKLDEKDWEAIEKIANKVLKEGD